MPKTAPETNIKETCAYGAKNGARVRLFLQRKSGRGRIRLKPGRLPEAAKINRAESMRHAAAGRPKRALKKDTQKENRPRPAARQNTQCQKKKKRTPSMRLKNVPRGTSQLQGCGISDLLKISSESARENRTAQKHDLHKIIHLRLRAENLKRQKWRIKCKKIKKHPRTKAIKRIHRKEREFNTRQTRKKQDFAYKAKFCRF